MNLQAILDTWDTDGVLKRDALDIESLRIPRLHAKYLKFLSSARMRAKAEQLRLKGLRHTLEQYYRGELNNPERLKQLGREPWSKKVLKNDISTYVNADVDVIAFEQRLVILNEKVEVLADILDQITKLSFVVRCSVDYQRFLAGG